MTEEEEKGKKVKYLTLFIKIAVGFLIVTVAFPLVVYGFFSNWTTSGTFGDSFGALNAFFSGLTLSGVIVTILIQRSELENQRIELRLQRNELKETRKEFLLNRTTSLFYSQLDRFEKALSDFVIKSPEGIAYKGHDAILYLNENDNFVYFSHDKSEYQYSAEMKVALIELLKIYTLNKSDIEKFAHNIYTSVEVLKRLIYKTDLEINELNDLKNLFFVNIGFINMGVIERIAEVAKLQLEYLEGKDYFENNIDMGSIFSANIFLEPIIEFYKLRLTKENFEENKSKWTEALGNLEK